MANFRIDDWSGGITDHYINGQANESERCDNLLISRTGKLVSRSGSVVTEFFEPVTNPISQIASMITKTGKRLMVEFFNREAKYSIDKVLVGTATGTSGYFGSRSSQSPNGADHVSYEKWRDQILFTSSIDNPDATGALPSLAWLRPGNTMFVATSIGWMDSRLPVGYVIPVVAPTSTFLWAVIWEFEYKVGSTTFLMKGPVHPFKSITRSDVSGALPFQVEAKFPSISFPGSFPSDVNFPYGITPSDVIMRAVLYRTVANGTVLYSCGSVTIPSTNPASGSQPYVAFSSTQTDATISLNPPLYTTAGVLSNEPPPCAKYLTMVKSAAFYGNCSSNTFMQGTPIFWPNRIYQSVFENPLAVPPSNHIDLDGTVTALNRVSNFPVAFMRDRTFRLEGTFSLTGSGGIKAVEISGTVGCISNGSVVRWKNTLLFAAEDGFYWTDGFKVTKISSHLDLKYREVVAANTNLARIKGALDPVTDRVYWSYPSGNFNLQESSVSPSLLSPVSDTVIVADLSKGVSPTVPFTTWSGGGVRFDWSCTAIEFFENKMYRGTFLNGIVAHDGSIYSDVYKYWPNYPNVSVVVPIPTKYMPVKWDWISSATSMGTNVNRKWVTQFNAIFRNGTDLSCVPYSSNDASGDFRALKEIRFQGSILWGDLNFTWGQDDLIWRYTGNIIVKRRFPAGTLRCTHKQIRLVKEPTVIIRSDDYGLVTVVKVAANYFAKLDVGSLATFTDTLVGYFIHFQYDGYSVAHEILEIQDAGLTLKLDGVAAYEGTGQKWLIRGIAIDESMGLESIDLSYSPFGEAITGWQTVDAGGNAGSK